MTPLQLLQIAGPLLGGLVERLAPILARLFDRSGHGDPAADLARALDEFKTTVTGVRARILADDRDVDALLERFRMGE